MNDMYGNPIEVGDKILLVSYNGSHPRIGYVTRFGKKDLYYKHYTTGDKEARKSPMWVIVIKYLPDQVSDSIQFS